MIHPLYFPHTYIPDNERDMILAWFERLSVYHSLDLGHPAPQGLTKIIPVTGNEDRLKAFLSEYRNFAALNIEKASAFLMGSNNKPFYDSTWASEIRSEIMKRVDDKADDTEDPEVFKRLWARAFLQIAHDYDQQNKEIDSELERVSEREKQLFDNLLGGDDDDRSELTVSSGRDGHQIPENRIEFRLAAWATLFVGAWPDASKTGEGFYLTSSPEVIETLGEYVRPFHKVCDLALNASTRETLFSRTTSLVESPYSGKDDETKDHAPESSRITLFIAPDQSPVSVFGRFLGKQNVRQERRPEIRNTVIGLIDI